jgi:hypothetical protein
MAGPEHRVTVGRISDPANTDGLESGPDFRSGQ